MITIADILKKKNTSGEDNSSSILKKGRLLRGEIMQLLVLLVFNKVLNVIGQMCGTSFCWYEISGKQVSLMLYVS